MTNGKKIPQALDLEESVLGAAIGCGGASELIELVGREKIFFKPEHQAIYDVIVDLYEKSEGIDLLTVSQALIKLGKLEAIGGNIFLVDLCQKVASAAHLEFHTRILQQMYVKRKAIEVGDKITKEAYNEESDIFELLESSYSNLDKVSDWLLVKKPTDFKSVVNKIFEAANEEVTGVPSSLERLQYKLNGYQKTNLIILAARPGMGKTALMINEALAAAKRGIPVGIFSLEMSDKELAARMFANFCQINVEKISLNKVDKFELRLMNEKREAFSKLPIYIHDKPAISPLELKIQASKWKREKGVEMLFVDYLQLMRIKSHKGNREQEVSDCSAALKGIAKELDVPVMALAQLSRAVEIRGGMKRPILSDLRESGSIEQDADLIMFLLRPEYYKVDEWDDDQRSPTAGQAEINIAKFRNGKVGACVVGCKLEFMQFHDLNGWEEIEENEEEFIPPVPEPNSNLAEAWDTQQDDDDDMPF
ncbi:replicative DNA helicase [Salinimicrobium sediminis]|uniref:Replicative DNA helicase n=1 Tax=Salinimicrobium sediminis TaxID=1343891 RepID=A0A285X3A5_9FLAO|nr:replicative DNA helicase [Salinimicrobium sediminis]SOC79841.1 replicative DNA helicase [Salinimicrobium sediminis]